MANSTFLTQIADALNCVSPPAKPEDPVAINDDVHTRFKGGVSDRIKGLHRLSRQLSRLSRQKLSESSDNHNPNQMHERYALEKESIALEENARIVWEMMERAIYEEFRKDPSNFISVDVGYEDGEWVAVGEEIDWLAEGYVPLFQDSGSGRVPRLKNENEGEHMGFSFPDHIG
jgi:hypothetical protein